MSNISGKIALVTGGSRGIGASIVEHLVKEGADVAFTYLSSPDRATALVDQLQSHGVRVKAYQSNASDHTQCKDLIAQVIQDFGKIDILVNNAGITRDN
ncbi:MAG: SDR family NAD(P)-dependent oxidoreductase, partial [Saprospiraceae bacterium]